MTFKEMVLIPLVMGLMVASAETDESCANAPAAKRGSLIQFRSARSSGPILDFNQLPEDLKKMGIDLFGSQGKVVDLLAASHVVSTSYANVSMDIAMSKNDDAATRFGPGYENGEEYGLDSLLAVPDSFHKAFELRRTSGSKMLNMIDMGANLGVVSIAVYKKYRGLVRAVIVEPVPTTHFYLQLNLFLNGIPKLQTGHYGAPQPGISAIQKAVSSNANFKLDMCTPTHDTQVGSMNSYLITQERPCDCSREVCSSVGSTTVESLFDTFGSEDITFLKMDCEGCEKDAMPVVDQKFGSRIRLLAGEMHMVGTNIVDMACKYNGGLYLQGFCQTGVDKFGPAKELFGKELCDVCMSDVAKMNVASMTPTANTPVANAASNVPTNIAPAVPGSLSLKLTQSSANVNARGVPVLDINTLPPELKVVGTSLFGSEAALVDFLSKSQVVETSYADVPMAVAMAKNDDAITRFGPGYENGEEYGLDKLLLAPDDFHRAFEARRLAGSKMLNMIDLGGNLGVVSMAVYKKYQGYVRAVVVEPVPTTHFYLRLNLWLNGIPPLRTGHAGDAQPGISVLQKAVSSDSNFKLDMCTPTHDTQVGSMNSFLITKDRPCDCSKDTCTSVPSMTVDSLFETFGTEDITFLKMDCEGCEKDAMPMIHNKYASRVRLLAGEMHMMGTAITDLACKYNGGLYLQGFCQQAVDKFGVKELFGKEFCTVCTSNGGV
mmetsp:Transcript_90493/g.160284  ORF Transcript_90493/g.160284 Transcript_90493/m.160284 type:complete len:718 (+) Transcript_90493:80-2233(+)